jgi:DNA-binding transcriptional regulator YhcF (GntR family)
MSIRLMSEVWRTNLPTVEKMVLLVIADHANDEGTEAWPSQATIAKKASVSIRTVQRSVNNLVKEGYLRMEKHRGGSATCREDRRPHRYTIRISKLRGDKETTRSERGDLHDLDGATPTPETGRLSRPKNLPNEPPLETPFDRFWSIYPIKVGKKKAEQAFDKASSEAEIEIIIEGAIRYAEDPNRVEQYTAHPTTWLNGGRWADQPLPDRELSKEDKAARELAEARRRSEIERLETLRWQQETEEARSRAVPMPEELRKLLRKSP